MTGSGYPSDGNKEAGKDLSAGGQDGASRAVGKKPQVVAAGTHKHSDSTVDAAVSVME